MEFSSSIRGSDLWVGNVSSSNFADLSLDDPQNLAGIFSRVASQHRQGIAIRHGRDSITYIELDILSNRVAHWLQSEHRVEHGELVCIAYPW